MPVPPPLLATRRAALGGALLGLGATGCRLDRPGAAPRAGARSGAAGGTARATPNAAAAPEDLDAALVDEVLAELTSLTHLTASVARHVPALRGPARALEGLHRTHREALGDEVPAGEPAGGPRPRDAAAALALLRRRETLAQRRLVDWAVAAQSGALARLLASMSAGIAQRVATLPARPGPARQGGAR